jgi:rfaE bifunctional protein nucleotidyltransferase chain/domain
VQHLSEKIYSSIDQLQEVLQKIKSIGKKIVFTNGCFDILHVGHVCYLEEARNLGDYLVIGVNADASVSRLKGPSRPINPIQQRMMVLAALQSVDAVISFSEDTPYELIKALSPDLLVKGGDWKVEDIVGSALVLAEGGQVLSLPFTEGWSTTSIEQKIKNNC